MCLGVDLVGHFRYQFVDFELRGGTQEDRTKGDIAFPAEARSAFPS
jgi:hypothetical protein